jgi:SAM-dependent methyltransferase
MKVCVNCEQRFAAADWYCPGCGRSPEFDRGYPVLAPDLATAMDGFDAEFFGRLARVESEHFWFEARNRLLIWALRTYFPEASSLLEIGCGTGFVLFGLRNEFPRLFLSGSDIYTEGLEYARERVPSAIFFQMDACRIPFEDEFDVIGAFDVIEHVSEHEIVLSQMFYATRRGGGILLTVPQHPFLWSVADAYARHKRRYTMNELVAKVRATGFEIVRVTGFVSLLLPAMLLIRRRKSKPTNEDDPLAELKIGRFSNVLLERILHFERRIIKSGFSFPFGGSLLVVAKRP